MKILIADDEKNIRKMLEVALAPSYTLEFAQDGQEALERLRGKMYDIALMDIKMPTLSGMDVLRAIRTECIDTPVLMMTAYGTVSNAVEAMKLGAVDFMSKPFTSGEIRSKIAELVAEQPREMELEQRMAIARKLIRSGDAKTAKKHLDRLLEHHDDSAQLHNLLGVVAEMNQQIERAQRHYRAALSLDPSDRAADFNLQRTIRIGFVPFLDALLGDEPSGSAQSPLQRKSLY